MPIEFRAGTAHVTTQLNVETNVGEQTPNQQQRDMKPAGNVGGDRPRMMPPSAKANPQFI